MYGKKWLLVAVFLLGGLILIGVGGKAFFTGRKLQREGKTTVASIVGRDARKVYKEQNAYYLTLTFETDAKEKITHELMVLYPEFTRTAGSSNVTIHYLPADPTTMMLDPIEVRTGQLTVGAVFTLAGVALLVLFIRFPGFLQVRPISDGEMKEQARPIATAAAGKILQTMAPLSTPKHEYVPADPSHFGHLDLKFYDDTRQLLESRGYVFLENVENMTLRNSAHNPNTFLRIMLGANGTITAGMYHFKPALGKRMVGGKEVKVLDLETEFANGCFVCTNNAGAAQPFSYPAEIDSLSLVQGTPFPAMLEAHAKRVVQFSERTGVLPVRLQTSTDVRRSQDALQALKAAYRQKVGLTRGELSKLSGGKAATAVDLMFEEIKKEQDQRQRNG